MVRTALADDFLLRYLSNVAKDYKCTTGLILGQLCLGKFHVVHFAKTPPFQSEDDIKEGRSPKPMRNISEVNENWLAEHARHATRMLPGGMCVLGMFVVSDDDVLSPVHAKIKTMLSVIHKQLSTNEYLYGSIENEKLILYFSPKTLKFYAKTYDAVTFNVQPVDFKFLPKATKWSNLECKYEIDRLHYLKSEEANWPLRKHIKVILDDIKRDLESSVFLFDGESKGDDECLENIGKKRKVPRGSSNKIGHHDLNDGKPMQVSIFQLCNNRSESQTFEICDVGGQIRIVGEVASKLWLNPKVTINDASNAVIQDIMRSLTTRLDMHWDSLTEEEHSEDVNSVHEPPRRVLVTLPESNVSLSDYLFPGEGPEDAKLSLEEMLDVKIDEDSEVQDVEGQADITQYYNGAMESDSEEILPKLPGDANKFMYVVGIAVAFFVLVLSLLMHFYKQ